MNTQERYDNRLKLRAIIKTLAAEQRKAKTSFAIVKAGIPVHARSARMNPLRTGIVHSKSELRYLYLAYALLRGRPYAKVEQKCNDVAQSYLIWHALKRIQLHEQYDKAGIYLWLAGKPPAFDVPELPDVRLPVPVNLPEMPGMKAAGGGGG